MLYVKVTYIIRRIKKEKNRFCISAHSQCTDQVNGDARALKTKRYNGRIPKMKIVENPFLVLLY